jgi:hypothetical protein
MPHGVSPILCNVPKPLRASHDEGKRGGWEKGQESKRGSLPRVDQFPLDAYETLEVISKEKKVSLAWVVREAAEKYIADKWPLFGAPKGA